MDECQVLFPYMCPEDKDDLMEMRREAKPLKEDIERSCGIYGPRDLEQENDWSESDDEEDEQKEPAGTEGDDDDDDDQERVAVLLAFVNRLSDTPVFEQNGALEAGRFEEESRNAGTSRRRRRAIGRLVASPTGLEPVLPP